jgi:hypothetical protein
MTTVDLMPADPEAAAFFADARAALTEPQPAADEVKESAVPEGWPMTPRHAGQTITVGDLHAMRGHAIRISFDWMTGRRAMWIGREFGGWAINQGQVDGPASMVTTRYDWAETVRHFNEYLTPGRAFGGPNMTVDEWVPEFARACLVHGNDCADADGGHHFVQRRTLPLYPAGTYRTCGACSRDGDYRYRYQVDGSWRLRYGCRSHHSELLHRYRAEADGTVTVRRFDDHLPAPA